MRQTIIKYVVMVLALVVSGEAYLVLEELRQLRTTSQTAIQVAQNGVIAVRRVNSEVVKARSAVDILTKKSKQAASTCSSISSELREIREELRQLRRKLRLQTQVLEEIADE